MKDSATTAGAQPPAPEFLRSAQINVMAVACAFAIAALYYNQPLLHVIGLTFGTTQAFLEHFGLEGIGDLPGLEELKGTGMLEGRLPAGFSVPLPSDDAALREDEDPLEPGDLDLGLAPRVEPEG